MEKNLEFRVGAMLLKPVFRRLKLPVELRGVRRGAPLLGVNGVCVIAPRQLLSLAIKNAIRVAAKSARSRINARIKEELDREQARRPTSSVRPVRIVGTGSFVPENVLTNADLEKMVDTSDEWIVTRTGIKERRIAPPEMAATDLA